MYYWNKPMETIGREDLERIQLERLQRTVLRMYTNVPFYRERMQQQGVKPEDVQSLADLRLLPFMDKRDLRDNYPFGTFAAPRQEIVRIHASSGTTGKPIVAGYTANDLQMWAECVARGLGLRGCDEKRYRAGGLWLRSVHRGIGPSLRCGAYRGDRCADLRGQHQAPVDADAGSWNDRHRLHAVLCSDDGRNHPAIRRSI